MGVGGFALNGISMPCGWNRNGIGFKFDEPFLRICELHWSYGNHGVTDRFGRGLQTGENSDAVFVCALQVAHDVFHSVVDLVLVEVGEHRLHFCGAPGFVKLAI